MLSCVIGQGIGRRCRYAVLVTLLVSGWWQGAVAQQYLGPTAVAVSPGAERMYVACADARQVLWVTLPQGEVERRVAVPAEPTGLVLSPDGQQLFVTCAASQSPILQISVESGEVTRTLVGGHTACSPLLDRAGDKLFVCNRFSNDVTVYRVSTGAELARVRVPREPVAVALTPDERRLVVANHLPHRSSDPELEENVNVVVTLVDTATYETTDIELFRGASSVRGMCVTPDGRFALVTHLLSNFENVPFRVDMGWINVNVVSVVDLQKMKTLSAIGLDELYRGSANPWGIGCSDDGATTWVTSAGTHQLSCMPTSELVGEKARRTMSPLPGAWPVYPSLGETLWRRASVPGRGPRSLAVKGNSTYAVEYYSDSVAVASVDDAGEISIRSIPLGPTPEQTLSRKGQQLFDDATICYQQWQSCASCHPDGRSDSLNWDLMNDGVGNPKNSKSMVLSHQTPPAMIKGIRPTAEVAVRSGMSHILFANRPEEEAVAIDAYLNSLKPLPSPHLNELQLSDAAERGKELFDSERVGCSRCHPAPLFTDMRTHRIGRTNSRFFENLFDTPTLIEVWRTAPYLHDGQFATVKELLHDGKHGLRRSSALSEQEIDDLTEYVLSL